jgi:hypothetical protein
MAENAQNWQIWPARTTANQMADLPQIFSDLRDFEC